MKTGILLIIIWFCTGLVQAQSVHYWSNRFNTKSSLLGDAVVAGNSGIASIYFNPAHIPESEYNQFSLSANLINMSYASYRNALGKGLDMIDYGFVVQPRFVSMIINSKKVKGLSWQFGIYNRTSSDNYIYNDYTQEYPDGFIVDKSQEVYQGVFDYRSTYSDYRGSMGSGYKINEQWNVGAAITGVVKNYFSKITTHITINGLDTANRYYTAAANSEAKLNAYDVRLTGIAGVSYKGKRMSWGMTVHLPSLKLWGNADVLKAVNQSITLDGADSLLPSFSYNESGKYRYDNFKDPLSVAMGFIFGSPEKKMKYYFSTEYFFPLKEYKLIDGTRVAWLMEDEYQPGTAMLDYVLSTRGILNMAVGVEYDFKNHINLLAGFKTDFDASNRQLTGKVLDDLRTLREVPFNYYHFNFGAQFTIKNSSIIAGAQYNVGIKKGYWQYANFKDIITWDAATGRALQGPLSQTMDYSIHDLGFYFGILFGF